MKGVNDRCLGCDTRLSTLLNDERQEEYGETIPMTREEKRSEAEKVTEEEKQKKMKTLKRLYGGGRT